MRVLNILALDLGTNTGFAYNHGETFVCSTWNLGSPKQVKEWGKTRLTRRCDPRVSQLAYHIEQVHVPKIIDLVIFEDVLFCSTTYACQLWASLRAAVWLSGIPRMECVPVQTLKIFATGRGNATKQDMARAALPFGSNLHQLDDNGIDAFHLHRWAKHHIKIKV